ncbi:MAG: bacterial Ig-like domain-containing protein, partial [Faecalibacterium sp.]|nr:bacterial Ig-like domain-containing protein [Ruminococcus sp.]MCM1486559.1 bacterial Ig-like domain-containing protein [Faecalibacterium sp.]
MNNTVKRISAFFVTVVMVLSMLSTMALAVENDTIVSVSDAAEQQNVPDEIITTYEQLKTFADKVNNGDTYEGKLVRLDVNIELGGEANPWMAIGQPYKSKEEPEKPFKGTFDGNYHVISGLYINASTTQQGLFGIIGNGGTVKNVSVKGQIITSSGYAAGIAGTNKGTIENCLSEVNITCTKGGVHFHGGIAGGNSGTITGCANVGSLNISLANSATGGIAGQNTGIVSNCYNVGEISNPSGSHVGGVVGQMRSSGATVESCFNIGKVTGSTNVGGVAGQLQSKAVKNCFNLGIINGKTCVGAVIGQSYSSTENENNYYLIGTATYGIGSSSNTDGAKTSDEMKAVDFAALLGSSFESGSDYPVLAWEKNISTAKPVRPAFNEKTELSAKLASYIRLAVNSTKTNYELNSADSLLGNEKYLSDASSTATDWMALAMGRFGYRDIDDTYRYMIDDGEGYEKYLAAMKSYIEERYTENNGHLNDFKATEWHRAAVAIAALQGDPLNFGTYNDQPINLIADGSYSCVVDGGVAKQGINGLIWGLIALDAGFYDVPDDASLTRQGFIEELLKLQLTDGANGNEYGGWVLSGYGSSSDVDITAMAIQALAPYYNDDTVYTYTNESSKKQVAKTVRQCVDEALDRLGSMFSSDAAFSSWDTQNVECAAQVLVALCSLGINPANDGRFITEKGETLLDGIMKFRVENGGFSHTLNGGWNSMATDQVTYALVAYWRFENGLRSLYDMREEHTKDFDEKIASVEAAISEIPNQPTNKEYKEKIKAALEKADSIKFDERRYIGNYEKLATALSIIGGRDKADTDEPFITSIIVTRNPNVTTYFAGEKFNKTGMIVAARYSDGSEEEISDYRISQTDELKLGVDTVYVIYGLLKTTVTITVLDKLPWSGEGTENNPYLITNTYELTDLARRVNDGNSFENRVFVLADNIDLSDIQWTPIGLYSSRQFDGIFDGQGYAIDNLSSERGGLFGYVGSNAVIKNVGVASGIIKSPYDNLTFVGGIAGWSNGADFINCWNGADVYSLGYSAGIVGTVRDGGSSKIENCYNIGNVYSSYKTENGVYGGTHIGGIVGHLATTADGREVNVIVENCYNTGKIVGLNTVGGIAGMLQDGHKVLNCYNTGEVMVVTENENMIDTYGAVIGGATSKNIIENCYYDNTNINKGVCDNFGITDTTIGKTADEMKSAEFLALLGDSFKQDKYCLVNSGYPLLSYQKTYDADDVDVVADAISAFGTNLTAQSETIIIAARKTYDELDDSLKEYVPNYDVLVSAEKATIHNFGAWKTIKNATCTTNGSKSHTCSVCGKTETQAIAKLGHNYSKTWTTDKKATCTSAGSKSHHCTRCNAKTDVTTIKATGHKPKVTITKATASKAGKTVTTCTVCNKTISTVAIAKIASVKLSKTSYVYDGKAKTPSVTVKDSNGKTL